MKSERYDLAVIGSGPAGQKAAIAAAKLGKNVVLVDKAAMLGGVSLHKGTIPSKTLRDTVFNYPTMAEVYKVAAIDGLNKVRPRPVKPEQISG